MAVPGPAGYATLVVVGLAQVGLCVVLRGLGLSPGSPGAPKAATHAPATVAVAPAPVAPSFEYVEPLFVRASSPGGLPGSPPGSAPAVCPVCNTGSEGGGYWWYLVSALFGSLVTIFWRATVRGIAWLFGSLAVLAAPVAAVQYGFGSSSPKSGTGGSEPEEGHVGVRPLRRGRGTMA